MIMKTPKIYKTKNSNLNFFKVANSFKVLLITSHSMMNNALSCHVILLIHHHECIVYLFFAFVQTKLKNESCNSHIFIPHIFIANFYEVRKWNEKFT